MPYVNSHCDYDFKIGEVLLRKLFSMCFHFNCTFASVSATTYPRLKTGSEGFYSHSVCFMANSFQGCVLTKVKLVEKECLLLVFRMFFTFRNYACWYWVCFKKLCLCMFFSTEYQYRVKRTR